MPDPRLTEVWRQIKDFPTYDVSSFGRVRSWRHTHGGLLKTPKILKLHKHHQKGYLFLRLVSNVDGKQYNRTVHRLVLEAFIGPCPKGMEARHFPDNDRANARLDNLSWATPQVNNADKVIHGTTDRGENHYSARLTDELVREIRLSCRPKGDLCGPGETATEMAKRFKVHRQTIVSARDGKSWRHVT